MIRRASEDKQSPFFFIFYLTFEIALTFFSWSLSKAQKKRHLSAPDSKHTASWCFCTHLTCMIMLQWSTCRFLASVFHSKTGFLPPDIISQRLFGRQDAAGGLVLIHPSKTRSWILPPQPQPPTIM